MPKPFSIVICTLNRADCLDATLSSLAYLRHPAFEVVVVNGPSTDDTKRVLARRANGIRIVECPEANLAMSRNMGIAAARGEIVAFLDDDAVPEPDWLDQLDAGYSHDHVACVGGFIRDRTGVAYQSKVTVCDRFGDVEDFDSIEEANVVNGRGARRYFSPTGTNVSFRRTHLLMIGGFDEEFAYFLDETDANLRIVDAGYDVCYVPAAEVHHRYAPSQLRRVDKVPHHLYLSARSKAYFCCRNGLPGGSLGAVFDRLGRYVAGLKHSNLYYLNEGIIDSAHYERLVSEVDSGVRDGIHDALSTRERRLLSEELLAQHANEAFKPFPIRLPTERRLRVCFISREYPPSNCGGIGVWTHALATALAESGHEVSVVSRSEDGARAGYEQGVWVHRIPSVSPRPDRDTPELPELPQTVKDHVYGVHQEVKRIHRRRGLDVVSSPIWDLEGLACIISGALPTVLSLHTTYKLALPSRPDWLGDGSYLKWHVEKVIRGERFAIEQAPFVLANSTAIVKDMEESYGVTMDRSRVAVVPHGLQDLYGKVQPYSRADDEVRLLFVGRLEPRKGVDTLLDALPMLLRANPRLRAFIVGDDSLSPGGCNLKTAFLRRHADSPLLDRVHFEGVVPREQVVRHYASCDIFVAPSRYESFGLVFLEAMMFAKPCVGTRVGGIQEVVTDGVTGLLVHPGDPQALAVAVQRLIDDPVLRSEIGNAARQSFERNFGIELMRDRVLRFLFRVRRASRTGSELSAASGMEGPFEPPIREPPAMHEQGPAVTTRPVRSFSMDRGYRFQQAEGVEVTQVGDGYILYRPDRARVHFVNHTAVLVLELCNGQTPADDIPDLLRQAYGLSTSPDEEVWQCLQSLYDEGIIR